MKDLTQQKCVACEKGMPPLNKVEAEVLLKQVPEWQISADSKTISRHFEFKDFVEALAFVNKVGEIAEKEQHHPDIHLVDYKFVNIDLSTHAIGGLSQNDFIVSSKINNI